MNAETIIREHMKAIGAKGGQVKSAAKVEAAKRNALKASNAAKAARLNRAARAQVGLVKSIL